VHELLVGVVNSGDVAEWEQVPSERRSGERSLLGVVLLRIRFSRKLLRRDLGGQANGPPRTGRRFRCRCGTAPLPFWPRVPHSECTCTETTGRAVSQTKQRPSKQPLARFRAPCLAGEGQGQRRRPVRDARPQLQHSPAAPPAARGMRSAELSSCCASSLLLARTPGQLSGAPSLGRCRSLTCKEQGNTCSGRAAAATCCGAGATADPAAAGC
jgi:hypothetical protein